MGVLLQAPARAAPLASVQTSRPCACTPGPLCTSRCRTCWGAARSQTPAAEVSRGQHAANESSERTLLPAQRQQHQIQRTTTPQHTPATHPVCQRACVSLGTGALLQAARNGQDESSAAVTRLVGAFVATATAQPPARAQLVFESKNAPLLCWSHLHKVGARVCCVAVGAGVAAASCSTRAAGEAAARQAAVCEGED